VAGLEHRIGGLEKADVTGNVSYDGKNHELMTHLRADKVARVASGIPDLEVDDPSGDAQILVLGWGGTHGSLVAGVARARARGRKVALAQLVHLNPLPKNMGALLARYEHVLVPELNLGQLAKVLRASYLKDIQSLSKMQGVPFRATEIDAAIEGIVKGES
jgi:2-oxoglutarate ferredoxin oxidoreductase subunit alpha